MKIEPLEEVGFRRARGISGQTKITLSEVIERTLANDPDLRISRIQRDQAGFSVRAAQGAYDPVLGFGGSRTRAVVPVASILGGSYTGKLTETQWSRRADSSAASRRQAAHIRMQFTNSRQQNDSSFNTLNPQYPTSVTLNVTQPLWRGLMFDEGRYRLQVARKNTQLSQEQLRQRIIEVVTQAVGAYWELDYAAHNLDVQVEAVRLAERQYQSNQRLADQGVLAPVDVVAAQTQVATFEQSLFAAQQLLTQAENNLKTMMLPNRTDLMWSMALVVDSPLSAETKPPSLEDAITRALKSRPELASSALAIAVNRLDTKFSHELAKPRVDLYANLSESGLSGIPTGDRHESTGGIFSAGDAIRADAADGKLRAIAEHAGVGRVPFGASGGECFAAAPQSYGKGAGSDLGSGGPAVKDGPGSGRDGGGGGCAECVARRAGDAVAAIGGGDGEPVGRGAIFERTAAVPGGDIDGVSGVAAADGLYCGAEPRGAGAGGCGGGDRESRSGYGGDD